jgi:Kef-type K+ transport system membrane component KefB
MELPTVVRTPRPYAYPLLVGLPVVGLLVVLRLGAGLAPSRGVLSSVAAAAAARPADVVLHLERFLAQIVVILLVVRALGWLLARVGQPVVVGEMLAGILLGPSILGARWPGAYASLFPLGSVRFLGAVSQLGLIVFMFLVGATLRIDELRGRGHTAVLTSHASIVIPLFLGAATSLLLYGKLAPQDVHFVPFALFVGAALSVTAFPVLARILAERGLTGTRLGALALASAAVDDVSAWCILAVVASTARGATSFTSAGVALVGTALFAVALLTFVRPLLAPLAARAQGDAGLTRDALAIVVLIALASAWVTQSLGTHALFGAFIGGVAMPKDAAFVRKLTQPLEDVILVILLPLFFAVTGVRMRLDDVGTSEMWPLFVLLLVVAVAGKLAGSAGAARASGLSWRESLSLGTLMNTRGLMGLVILNAGLELGVLSRPLFVMLVLISIITTMITTPLLSLIRGKA